MGLNNTYGLGRTVRASIQTEASFGGGPPIVSNETWLPADSFQVLGGVPVEPSQDRKVRSDARQSRSAVEIIQGTKANSVTVRTYVLPPSDPGSGSATTGLPDVAPLLAATFGVETVGASAVTYSLSNSQAAPPSVTALFEYNGIKSDLIKGWVVEEFRLSIPNGDEPTLEFTGPAREQVIAGASTATAAITGGAASETVTLSPTSDSYLFEVGAYISIGTSTHNVITAVNHTTGVLTIADGADPGTANIAAGTGTAIVPYTAYAEGSGSAGLEPSTLIASINGQLDLGSDTDIVFQAAEVVVKNTWGEIRPAFTDLVADQNPGFREVTGSVTFWVRDVDVIRALARPRAIQTAGVNPLALVITLGGMNTGDGQAVMTIPAAHLNFAAADIPEAESGSVQVPFTALASTITAEDEISLVFSQT